MLIFLAILTVTNLALGFGLAVYLLRTGAFPARLLPVALAARSTPVAATPAPPAKPSPATADDEDDDEQAQASVKSESPEAAKPAAKATGASEKENPGQVAKKVSVDEVEEDVMAGIEAFRAQLAQMNDDDDQQPAENPKAAPAAATAQ